MKFKTARQCIHDAFSIQLGTPSMDNSTGSRGTKFDADVAIFNGVKAGVVISATLKQDPHLRGTAIVLNAPVPFVQEVDSRDMRRKVWSEFISKNSDISPADQGDLVCALDKIIYGYRSRAWNPRSISYSIDSLFSGGTKKEARLIEYAKKIETILGNFDSDSLQPIWHVIAEQKEAMIDEGSY